MLFAHGFEGSPTGSKPTYMREAFGWKVTAPKMSDLGWSIASQTDVLIKHLDEGDATMVRKATESDFFGLSFYDLEG